ncbi:D-2-hydroxyacid dehydrogenase [Halobacillus litoralis]|uniref:D-2-hydroxyacid dehydrogenase n=1 Tax=Halobacillus litoralis TaxID=45668 RepID=UPI001CD3347E|nr:D-2-hydroxyacid dehydrogenase [Halobacillus litoralis]MCA0971799.1 D-2-hydroxyacid dehydrogenase [Halobacillus litoralis]
MKVVSAIKRVPDEIRSRLTDRFTDVEFMFCHGIEEAEPYLEEADIFLTYGEDLTPERVKSAERLKWIMVLSAGMDRMPFKEIEEQGIVVTNVRGIHAKPMAEYAISMLLQVERQAKVLIEQEKKHNWNRRTVMTEIGGKTLLLLGTGAIAQEVARLGKAFHMRTLGVSKSGNLKSHFDETYSIEKLDQVIHEADYIVAALPSTNETIHLLKNRHFQSMKNHAVFLNMGRGDLVSTEVLLNAVRNEWIGHAVLDVFEEEPLSEGHALWDEERVTITPHLSGISPHYVPRAFEMFEKNLEVYVTGQGDMLNIINLKRGY